MLLAVLSFFFSRKSVTDSTLTAASTAQAGHRDAESVGASRCPQVLPAAACRLRVETNAQASCLSQILTYS